ncbi:chaplin [Streptomyces sp. cg35]|uniref:chaplin n=1 Tax=Streptomyces sp. cg35 TaxID=3421650 RepID=UPI003D175B3C
MAAAAATGILSMPGTSASAMTGDQEQSGGSPGVLSGNSVAAPLSVPVNLCGNSVDGVAAANPASGNHCAGRSDATAAAEHDADGYGDEAAGSHADEAQTSQASSTAQSAQSGGVLSGNSVQAPVDIGLDLCGNTVDVVGALNPVTGNACANSGDASATPPPAEAELPPAGPGTPATPATDRAVPAPGPVRAARPVVRQEALSAAQVPVVRQASVAREQLADTGADQNLLAAAAASAGLLVGGGVLYRRARAAGR